MSTGYCASAPTAPGHIWLNRPGTAQRFNDTTIQEITHAFQSMGRT